MDTYIWLNAQCLIQNATGPKMTSDNGRNNSLLHIFCMSIFACDWLLMLCMLLNFQGTLNDIWRWGYGSILVSSDRLFCTGHSQAISGEECLIQITLGAPTQLGQEIFKILGKRQSCSRSQKNQDLLHSTLIYDYKKILQISVLHQDHHTRPRLPSSLRGKFFWREKLFGVDLQPEASLLP